MSISKIFIPNFVYQILCVFSQIKDTKHIRWDFFILLPGSCPRSRTLGHWGYLGGQTIFFFKHGHVAYQIDGDDEQISEQNASNIFILGSNW